MPPRRKPTSTRQKKADIQLKRAIKRGDVPPPEQKPHRAPTSRLVNTSTSDRLQSTFIALSPTFLEETKFLASTLPLPRPIPPKAAVFIDVINPDSVSLSCPRRPKWRYDMSKKDVEHNEEGVFKKWLEQTDGTIHKWQNQSKDNVQDLPGQDRNVPESSPTFFERNLEVWRQLWRVTEISQILLVLLDSRCPLLHFPPSLATYLSGRKVILVLTKVDISGAARAAAWTDYFRERYPHLRVVQVESYVGREPDDLQGCKRHIPRLPITFRERLVEEIKQVHAEMLQPPDKVKANAKWFQQWNPPVKVDIDWVGVLNAEGSEVGTVVGTSRPSDGKGDDATLTSVEESGYLTIGLIGQPNVGKSSLLNALFGKSRVRASKTPGKTKHFQTLFWTSDVRLVDCPGLVMPSFIPMEMQVLSGVLPISRVSAVPSCIHYASQFLPLECIYKLTHPLVSAPAVEDKRTWREGIKIDTKAKLLTWTAMDILVAFANTKGWVTAKAGRPDIHRAGNAILRTLAEGKIKWAFWPPDITIEELGTDHNGHGIWISGDELVDEDTADDSELDERDTKAMLAMDGDYGTDSTDENVTVRGIGTRFEALMLDDVR